MSPHTEIVKRAEEALAGRYDNGTVILLARAVVKMNEELAKARRLIETFAGMASESSVGLLSVAVDDARKFLEETQMKIQSHFAFALQVG